MSSFRWFVEFICGQPIFEYTYTLFLILFLAVEEIKWIWYLYIYNKYVTSRITSCRLLMTVSFCWIHFQEKPLPVFDSKRLFEKILNQKHFEKCYFLEIFFASLKISRMFLVDGYIQNIDKSYVMHMLENLQYCTKKVNI